MFLLVFIQTEFKGSIPQAFWIMVTAINILSLFLLLTMYIEVLEFVTCPFTVVFVLPRPLLMKSTVCIRLQFYIPTHIHILMKTLTQSLFSFVHMNTKQR